MGLIDFPQWKQHLWRSRKMKASTCVRQTVTLGLNYVYHTANMCRLVFSVTLTQPTEVSCFETMVETVPTLIALIILCIRLTKPFGTKLSSIWFLKWKVLRWVSRKKPKRRLTQFQSSLFSPQLWTHYTATWTVRLFGKQPKKKQWNRKHNQKSMGAMESLSLTSMVNFGLATLNYESYN